MGADVEGPQVLIFSRPIPRNDESAQLYLVIVEYGNAIQAAVYLDQPLLGSMSLGFQLGDNVERNVLFQGKHEQLASTLALLLAKETDKIVYASVNIPKDVLVTTDIIADLIQQYSHSRKQ